MWPGERGRVRGKKWDGADRKESEKSEEKWKDGEGERKREEKEKDGKREEKERDGR